MSSGINKVILVGNLGRDADCITCSNGSIISKISIATSESWKDKQSNQTIEKTEWHNITFFNRLAEIARDYLKKGSLVYIEGKLETQKYKDKEGNEKSKINIVANSLKILSSKSKEESVSNNIDKDNIRWSSENMSHLEVNKDSFNDNIPF